MSFLCRSHFSHRPHSPLRARSLSLSFPPRLSFSVFCLLNTGNYLHTRTILLSILPHPFFLFRFYTYLPIFPYTLIIDPPFSIFFLPPSLKLTIIISFPLSLSLSLPHPFFHFRFYTYLPAYTYHQSTLPPLSLPPLLSLYLSPSPLLSNSRL